MKRPAVLDGFASLLNRINDWDLTWVGFGKLRPSPDQKMTGKVVAILCIVYCPITAALAVAMAWLILREHAPSGIPWVLAGAAAAVFVVLQSLLAWAWNRRAVLIRQQKTPSSQ